MLKRTVSHMTIAAMILALVAGLVLQVSGYENISDTIWDFTFIVGFIIHVWVSHDTK